MRPRKRRKRQTAVSKQLCWTCQRATGGCSWSDNLQPVEGWTAKPSIIRDSGMVEIPTYSISDCPLYVQD